MLLTHIIRPPPDNQAKKLLLQRGFLMKTWYTRFFLALVITISGHTMADSFGFAISNDYLEIEYQNPINNNLAMDAAWVYTDNDGVKINFVSAGFYAYNKTQQFEVYLGGKPYYLDGDKDGNSKLTSGHGILLGGAVNMHVADKAYVSAELFYAPDILTGGDFENTIDTGISATYQVLPNADLALGYRFLETETGKFDYEVYKGLYLSFKVNI
jgi:hypothetical protein